MKKISKIIKGVPSSFVFKNMKLDTDKGAGEAKLFVGPKSQIEDINDFFKFDQAYSYRFDKSNLLNYLHEVKMEYVFQHVNKYKDASIETWQEFYTTVENMQDSEMQIHLTEFTDTSRVYVRANEEIFGKLFRKIIVPKLTDVEFVRDDDTREIIVLLKVNYEYDKESNESSEVVITDGIIFNTGYESPFSRNRILFGAPGTGKSFTINRDRVELLGVENEDDYERVTFHPDYSYANFVGTYKPVMVDDSAEIISLATEKEVLAVLTDETKTAQEKYDQLYERFKGDGLTRLPLLLGLYTDESFKTRKADGSDAAGDNSVERNHGRAIRPYVNLSKPTNGKKDISYEYVPGPFMRMYVKALKNSKTDNIKPFLLIIEEINRANVAAVFGDVFQLLDRGDDFVSEYPIQATEDIKKYLAKELGGNPDDYNKIKIPDNMFIWATMNSADQGVFPMDTAFKRRWDFTYLGIDDNDQDLQGKYVYLADDKSQKVEWNKLRKAINNFLAKEKINEDKQLGPYFISRSIVVPKDSEEIDRDRFINTFKNKVIMYLFEDAAKQKRPRLFEGCFQNSSRYSEICREFEAKGVGIFNHDIQLDCEVEDVKSGESPQE